MFCERCQRVREDNKNNKKYCVRCTEEMEDLYYKYAQDVYHQTKQYLNLIRNAE